MPAVIVLVLVAPTAVWARADMCLTGTASEVAGDSGAIGGVRDLVEVACPCGAFDGSPGKTHGDYSRCALAVVEAQVASGALRQPCKTTVKKYYARATCGLKTALGAVPCIKKVIATGKVTCAVKPVGKCVGEPGTFEKTACANVTHCLDAADVDHDLVLGSPGDDGSCVSDASTMNHKLLMGYQGWFACAGDGSPVDALGGWASWSVLFQPPSPSTVTVDFWPDTSELDPDELFATSFTRPDGSAAPLYSAYKQKTVVRHFKWMRDNDLDGVMLQRFVNVATVPQGRAFVDQVARNVRAGAEAYGRAFAVMYDTSGANAASLVSDIEADWLYLEANLRLTDSPRYLRHGGKPVVAIWGLGFTGEPATPAQAAELIAFFKASGATIMGGVPAYWRSLSNDSQTDPAWAPVYRSLDVISPWAVGRYADEAGADFFKQNLIVPDMAEAAASGAAYMPVVFPGFSWRNQQANAYQTASPLNVFPRNGGRFYWRQVYNAVSAGSTMLYGAMFDEVNEGTAMYKLAATPADMPAQGQFVPLDADGYDLRSDWYLRLANEAGKMLRGETPLSATIPITPP